MTSRGNSGKIVQDMATTLKEDAMRKVKYVKPGVVGGSSVHPC